MSISIRSRLTATFTLAITLGLLIANVAIGAYSTRMATRHADRVLHEAAKSTSHSLKEEWDEAEENLAADPVGTPASIDTAVPIQSAIRHTRQELSDDHIDVAVIEDRTGRVNRSDQGNATLPWPHSESDGWRVQMIQVPARRHATRYGTYSLAVGLPWYQTTADLREQEAHVGIISLFFVLVSALGTWILVGHTLRPISRLAQQARVFQRGVDARTNRIQLSASSPDSEVVGLVSTLNLLLGSIADSTEAKARFYTAASHELRTPLHVLSGQVELTLSRPRSAEAYEAAMIEVQRQTDRLTKIIESLLMLNRLDRGTREAPLQWTAVDAVCAFEVDVLMPLISERGLHFSSDIELAGAPGFLVCAPEMHIEIMLRNLIENAAKYATPGGEIRLGVHEIPKKQTEAQNAAVGFSIYNDAEAIDDASFNRLFEPFYRPDDSRTSGTGGNGLGLSICRALADANGWELSLRQSANGVLASVAFGEGIH